MPIQWLSTGVRSSPYKNSSIRPESQPESRTNFTAPLEACMVQNPFTFVSDARFRFHLSNLLNRFFFLVDNPTKLRLICTVFVCFRFHPAKIGAFLPFCGTSSNQTTSPSDVSMVRDAAIARITLDCANSSLMFAQADSLFS